MDVALSGQWSGIDKSVLLLKFHIAMVSSFKKYYFGKKCMSFIFFRNKCMSFIYYLTGYYGCCSHWLGMPSFSLIIYSYF